MAGKRFGRLVILERAGKNKHQHILWKCICDCNTNTTVSGISLRSGNTKSCGCLSRDTARVMNTKHGMSGAQEYNTWDSMVQRCNNPKNTNYAKYGGSGIKVCARWLKFENFFEDMGKRPEAKTLDRINPHGDYNISNCRWASYTTQSRNMRLDKRNKTGINGVFWHEKLQKYMASIRVNNKPIYIGLFIDIEQATIARHKAELKYWSKNGNL